MENSQLNLLLAGTKSAIILIERYIGRSEVLVSNQMMSELLEKGIGIKDTRFN